MVDIHLNNICMLKEEESGVCICEICNYLYDFPFLRLNIFIWNMMLNTYLS